LQRLLVIRSFWRLPAGSIGVRLEPIRSRKALEALNGIVFVCRIGAVRTHDRLSLDRDVYVAIRNGRFTSTPAGLRK
jgi:hypothetical protein